MRFNGSIAISLFATGAGEAWRSNTLTLFQWLNRHKPLCNFTVPNGLPLLIVVSMAQSP